MAFVGVGGAAVSRKSERAVCVRMSTEEPATARRDFLKSMAAFAVTLGIPAGALADREYEGVPYLGGSEMIDVNNANIRVYQKYPGLYPNIGRLIVSNGPYKTTNEIFNIKDLTDQQKEVLKKYEDKLIALEPRPEYEIDKINNGLYR